jgi:hypothetical protein
VIFRTETACVIRVVILSHLRAWRSLILSGGTNTSLNHLLSSTCTYATHFIKTHRKFFDGTLLRSRDSVVGIVTRYGLDDPGIESRWGEIFRTYPDRLRGPPSLLYNGYRDFPGAKGGRSVMQTIHPLLVPRLRKS